MSLDIRSSALDMLADAMDVCMCLRGLELMALPIGFTLTQLQQTYLPGMMYIYTDWYISLYVRNVYNVVEE